MSSSLHILLLLFFLFLNCFADESKNAFGYQVAYGVSPKFLPIASIRLLQYLEVTALFCPSGHANASWYRRAMRPESTSLRKEEKIYTTLMMDTEFVSDASETKLRNLHPQQYKFKLIKKKGGSLLEIHDSNWYDLGQYYCAVGDDLKAIYLVNYRPIILYIGLSGKVKKNKLNKIGTSGGKLLNKLEKFHIDLTDEDQDINMGENGHIKAMWRAYPFVDGFNTAFEGLNHSGYNWDDGDVVKWYWKPHRESEYKRSFRGILGKDLKNIKKIKRYDYFFDLKRGLATMTIKEAKLSDAHNATLLVMTARGPTYGFTYVRIFNPERFIIPLIIIGVEVVIVFIVTVIACIVDCRAAKRMAVPLSTNAGACKNRYASSASELREISPPHRLH